MIITFPTSPSTAAQPGLPDRAEPCRCLRGPLVLDDDTCVFCGHYPELTIHRTWRDRAREIAAPLPRLERAA